jgi:peptide/nickel transport system substrate-binding protein
MRPSEKLATFIALVAFILSGVFLYNTSIHKYGVERPAEGGRVQEGIIGYTRFINPLLAISDADKDAVSLIYSGLLKASPDGSLIPDLAESWNVSSDGLIYSFVLKPNLTFHDGSPLTTDDIEFTIQKATDPSLKSPRASGFAGVMVDKTSDREIKFILKKPYAPFAENLTLGILPKHIWSEIADDIFDISIYNRTNPIGSGPYMVKKISGANGDLFDSFTLVPFGGYALGKPKISTIVLKFYKNQEDAVDAFESGDIDTLGGISPEIASAIRENGGDDVKELQTPLPRIFALFFNQNTSSLLLRKEVRKALNMSVDRNALIQEVLDQYGSPIYSPIPSPSTLAGNASTTASSTATSTASTAIADAKKLLEANGWTIAADGIYEHKAETKGTSPAPAMRLAFTVTTSNSGDLKKTAEILREQWKQIGAEVSIEVYEGSDLTQKIIRPRKYSALLFGQVVGRDLDLYPFWHSSQRNDPGLNIAMYANAKADKALELARSTNDNAKKLVAESDFVSELQNDIPAVFLFSPNYTYLEHRSISGQELMNINDPSERFMNIHEWYLDTKYTWK